MSQVQFPAGFDVPEFPPVAKGVTDALGFTPANKAGDTFTGAVAFSFAGSGGMVTLNDTNAAGQIAIQIKDAGTSRGFFGSNATNAGHIINAANSIVLMSVANATGNLTAFGNVTASSDERLKENWRDLPADFLLKLAGVRMGIYDRKDAPLTQVGVGAQSLEEFLPEAIGVDESTGYLTVSYGNAALAACVKLAQEVLSLRDEIGVLRRVLGLAS